MSFNNSHDNDLERAETMPSQYQDFPEFENYSRNIENLLHLVKSTHLATIRNTLQKHEALDKSDAKYGQNAQELVAILKEAVVQCLSIFSDVNKATSALNEYLRQCELEHADEDAVSYLRQKEAILISTTKNVLHLFQRQQRKCVSLEKARIAALAALIDDSSSNTVQGQPSVPSQIQSQIPSQGQGNGLTQAQVQITYEPINAEELEQQLLLIQERERDILQIAQDTQQINEIYLNLQGIIQEQQFQIDTMEDNILSYQGDAQAAASELRRAERYQRRSGGRMLCCLIILLTVFGSVVLVMVVF